MARKLQIDWQESEDELCRLYKQEKDHQNRTRLQALWLLRPERTMKEVAGLVGVHYRTVQEWVAWYRKWTGAPPERGPGSRTEGQSGSRRDSYDPGRGGVGQGPRRRLYVLGHALGVLPLGIEEEGPPSTSAAGF